MSLTEADIPLVQSVLHPTDFSEESAAAFAYALAISLVRQTRLTILHAGKRALADDEWHKFPGVRSTLEQWGLLEPGSSRSAVFEEFAVRVKKVGIQDRNPAGAIVSYLADDPVDLVVLATSKRGGLPRWLAPSVAEAVAEKSRTMTMFVPNGSRGFVAQDTGSLSLRRILVPVERDHRPDTAVAFATRIARLIRAEDSEQVDVALLHVGAESETPPITYPEGVPFCSFSLDRREGDDIVGEIAAAAEAGSADLIVMTTKGHRGVFDALRGSTTQQVLRRSPCPLLAVPVD